MAKRLAPEVNAGSMADIAFLLLIFFLVTTTIASDTGLNRVLPPISENGGIINEKNLFQIIVNNENELLVETEPMELKDLKEATIAFLDNGGKTGSCNYCKGRKDITSSDNPQKAIVSLKNSRETSYKTYIKITNEVLAAYKFLRNREAMRLYKVSYSEIVLNYKNASENSPEKAIWKNKRDTIKKLFPEKFSEAESD